MDYIENYYKKEGIKLDYNNIKQNIGARQVAKIKANSQWGYLAMNTNRTKLKFVKTKKALEELMLDDKYIIHNIVPGANGNIIQVYYSETKSTHFGRLKTNVAIAAFVTSYARLRLYKEIEKLDKRVLYFDTDSIIFIEKDGKYQPTLGNFLGEFTNEIDPIKGNYITEFVSAGPKNYAYKLDIGVTQCTVKGFRLNHVASLKINFDSIKEIVCENRNEKINVNQLKFSINNKKWRINSEIINKSYGFVYDKRILLEDLTTLPYGF